ncbi:Transcription factor TFIIB, cyclin-like domain [Lasallia pustulata]|uniref:B-related factor 1 n=1 Tax=Lasallia pustulata TaxID=136370 RepID=A0A1W5D5B7_9LECA|nr:Transcription factor TFIIB, cyclin-like domain [Lasallia pustulata]
MSKVAPKAPQRPPRLDSLKNPQPRPPPQAAKAPIRKVQQRLGPKTCPNRDCKEKDVVEEDGLYICRGCGTVVSESNIVSEVTFGETSSGAAVVQGSYVGADQSHARNSMGGNLKRAGGLDSREITDANGKRYINQLSAALHLPDAIRDSAFMIFKLAVANNFIQGRRTKNVAAVCLYITCRRQDMNQTMLMDFSDVLMVNVFKLGQTYKALLDELRLGDNLFLVNAINPEDLIYRFAQRLEFGSLTMRVANEASKIVQRMNRDWMTTGRRPAGICGAALILAARMNNFRRTVREVVYVVKVTEITLHKRLDEFKYTESSALTVEQFRSIDLERACDPPAFYEQRDGNRKRRKQKTVNLEDEEPSGHETQGAPSAGPANANGQMETPTDTQQAQLDAQAMPPPPIPIDPQLLDVAAQRLSEIENSQTSEPSGPGSQGEEPPAKPRRGRPRGKTKKPEPPPASQIIDENNLESDISQLLRDPSTIEHANALHQALQSTETPPASQIIDGNDLELDISQLLRDPSTTEHANALHQALQPTETTPPPTQTLESTEPATSTAAVPAKRNIPDSEIIPEEEFWDDPEVRDCLLTEAEVEIKERIWVHENAEYLRAQQAKMLKKQLAEENGTARPIIKRKRRRMRMGDLSTYEQDGENGSIASSPAEATLKMMQKRGYSKKINYETLNKLYEPSTSGSTASGSTASGGEG